MIPKNGNSPAGRVMNEAIELDIEGRSPYPKRASFIDADARYAGAEIRESVDEGYAIVLVSADGSTCTLRAESQKLRHRVSRRLPIRRRLRA